ncbi:2Fe-2S iron-sulfur cluster binding domain-containing protein [Blastococcus sp. URHD0036]|uniref:2Fe-2S iron-sulfur cluster-binding protein n=1 Tax=Blastococcus sp. URHD0036 TaxID=1380356 RepID=UPI000494DAF1|nr:2Fe-2S iron-sulfur cluster binding domain-containing protein [Blastococcus sp. URHD0036]
MTQNGQALTRTQVTIRLGRRTVTGEHHPGTTVLETARTLGLTPPSSCEAGNCATCMARLEEGSAPMRANDVLEQDDLDEGWVLTCQAVPEGPSVSVVYE